jgi:multidrug resistance protein
MSLAQPSIEPMPTPSNNKILGIVFFTVFIDLIGFGIIIPIQPFFARSLGASPSVVTLLGASFSLMQFLFTPFWGRLSDKIGRKPVMLASISCNIVGYTLFAMSQNLYLLFFARALAGFGSANIGAAQAIIADSTDHTNRAKGMGLIGAAFGLGFIFGPAIGGFLGQLGLAAPAFMASFLCVLNLFFAYFFLPETFKPQSTPTKSYPLFSWKAFKDAIQKPNIFKLFLMYFIFISAFSMMEMVIGLFVESVWLPVSASLEKTSEHTKMAAKLTAYVLMTVGITATIIQGGLIGRLTKRFGEKKLLTAGTAIVTLMLCLFPFIGNTGNFGLFLFSTLVMAIGTGMINPSFSSFLSKCVDSNEQGSVLGLGQSLAALGRVIGPSVAGLFFEMHRGHPLWIASAFVFVCFYWST